MGKKSGSSANKIFVLGVDPGTAGALVLLGKKFFHFQHMPYKNKEVDPHELRVFLRSFASLAEDHNADLHVMLERAVPMAQGAKSAFSYGLSFGLLKYALEEWGFPVTHVEPGKWSKVMHEGIDSRLKPKAKSEIAVERLYPMWLHDIPRGPKSGKLHEGVVDALLIAGYGSRLLAKG